MAWVLESEEMIYAVGVDIGGTNTRVGLVDGSGNIIVSQTFSTNPANPYATLDRIAEYINNIKGSYSCIVGVGVGCAGIIDVERGIVRFSPNLPMWREIRVRENLIELTGLEVFVDNDANLFALAEARFGVGVGKSVVVGVTVGTGIGGGIVVDGKVFRGSSGGAGEIGHMIIKPDGPICNCGNYGCIEALAGSYAIERRANELFLKYGRIPSCRLTPEYIGKLAHDNDDLAICIINETAYYLGLFLVSVVHIFNPDVIVIGGGISNWGEVLLAPVRAIVFERAMKHLTENLLVERTSIGTNAGIIGAASIFL